MSKKRKQNKIRTAVISNSQHSRYEEAKRELDEKYELEQIEKDYKSLGFRETRKRIISYLIDGIRITLFVLLCVAIIASVVFLLWWIIASIKKEDSANVALTIMQVLTSIVSVGVGIWGLVLTLMAHKNEYSIQRQLNVSRSASDNNIRPKVENDVNPSTFN